MRTFIIGYGSLMNRASLNRTLPQVKNIEPIYLNNYIRSWNALENQTVTYSTTYVGIDKAPGKMTNGVIFQIEKEFIKTLDKREFLYSRTKVDIKDIEFTSNSFDINTEDEVWIYITLNPLKPTQNSPIIQSYVDVCISGCMQLEEEFKINNFAKNFILQTTNWSTNWVNDRIFPRAPHIHQPFAYNIDKLLHETVGEYFKGIHIE